MFNSMRDLLRVPLLSVACACVQAALLAQSYSPLFGPASANSQQWQCLDQYNQPIPGAYFTVQPGVYLYTNGHFHANPGYGIWNTAWAWVNAYNPGGYICVNDMALPYGGKFDTNQNWISPHASHDRGSAVDVATTSSQCPPASVVTNPNAFLQLCVANDAKPYPISQVDPADVHCNWTDPATYPH